MGWGRGGAEGAAARRRLRVELRSVCASTCLETRPNKQKVRMRAALQQVSQSINVT